MIQATTYSTNAVYKVTEVALIMRTTRDQVYAWIRSGRLPAFHLNGNAVKNLVHGQDIAKLIDSLKEETA